MMLLMCCTQCASNGGKDINGHRTRKFQFSYQSQTRAIVTYCSNYHTIVLMTYANKVMFKILQTGLQQYVNQKLPDVQARFRKGRGTRDKIANIYES